MFYDDRNHIICDKCKGNIFVETEGAMYERVVIKTEDMLKKEIINSHLKCTECGTIKKDIDLNKTKIMVN